MKHLIVPALLLALAGPAVAKWKLADTARTPVAASSMSVEGGAGWNRWSVKPIKHEEIWSLDGPLLDRVGFYGGIGEGEPLARETSKKREPLPHVAATMHASDVAELIERTVRITESAPDFTTEAVEPAPFAGAPGFRVRFRYISGELTRRGEARGRIANGKLYLISYVAPALHYFDAGLPRAEAIMDSARIG